jgi:hypothetical protein
MKRIQTYQSFFEGIFSRKINSQCLYSERLRVIFNRMKDISEEKEFYNSVTLLGAESTNQVVDDITLFDIGEDDSTITFIQTNRLNKMKEDDPSTIDWDTNQWIKEMWRSTNQSLEFKGWKEQRTSIGIGKFFTRIFKLCKVTLTDAEKEKLVNLYKSIYKQANDIESRLELVKGEDIRKWYFEERYQFNKGELSNSCMRYERCQEYLDIYVKNPEVCSLLILKGTEPDKIIGRAIVWNLSIPEGGITFMDRIYTNLPSDRQVFQNYSKKMGWGLTQRSSHLEVQLGKFDYSKFPYMDTLSYYNKNSHLLTNDDDVEGDDWLELHDTRGGSVSMNRVYSEWHGDYISRDNAVYCEDLDGYMDRDEARYVEYKNVWVSPDCEYVVWSEYHQGYYYDDDSIYCEYLDDHLYVEKAAEVYVNIGETEWVPDDFFQKGIADIVDIYDVSYAVTHRNLPVLSETVMIDPFTDKWVFKKEPYPLYWCEEKKEYVSKEEAKEQNLTIDEERKSSTWYSEYLTRKIGKVNPQVIVDYLKNKKPTPQEIDNMNNFFRGNYRLDHERNYNTEEKFNLVKLALFAMYSDKDSGYVFKQSSSWGNFLRNIDNNPEAVKELIGDSLYSMLPEVKSDMRFFISYASPNAMSLIKDKEALKTYIGLKYSVVEKK